MGITDTPLKKKSALGKHDASVAKMYIKLPIEKVWTVYLVGNAISAYSLHLQPLEIWWLC